MDLTNTAGRWGHGANAGWTPSGLGGLDQPSLDATHQPVKTRVVGRSRGFGDGKASRWDWTSGRPLAALSASDAGTPGLCIESGSPNL